MSDPLNTLKPAVPARWHLLLAALTWTVVGSLLSVFGTRWIIVSSPWTKMVLMAIAAAMGILKARFVLDRAADRIIKRIRDRGDGRCIGGFLSLPTWCLVAVMAGTGRWLRGGLLPHTLVGFIYLAIGIALLLACRRLWLGWFRYDSIS